MLQSKVYNDRYLATRFAAPAPTDLPYILFSLLLCFVVVVIVVVIAAGIVLIAIVVLSIIVTSVVVVARAVIEVVDEGSQVGHSHACQVTCLSEFRQAPESCKKRH